MTDHIGSVRDLVSYDADDDRITLEAHIKYNAFGEIISETDATGAAVTTDHIFGFTARERDNESDLNYYRNRYYDPSTGRFMTADPVEDDYENTYRYVNNDPVNKVDPSGLQERNRPKQLKTLSELDTAYGEKEAWKFFNRFYNEKQKSRVEALLKTDWVFKFVGPGVAPTIDYKRKLISIPQLPIQKQLNIVSEVANDNRNQAYANFRLRFRNFSCLHYDPNAKWRENQPFKEKDWFNGLDRQIFNAYTLGPEYYGAAKIKEAGDLIYRHYAMKELEKLARERANYDQKLWEAEVEAMLGKDYHKQSSFVQTYRLAVTSFLASPVGHWAIDGMYAYEGLDVLGRELTSTERYMKGTFAVVEGVLTVVPAAGVAGKAAIKGVQIAGKGFKLAKNGMRRGSSAFKGLFAQTDEIGSSFLRAGTGSTDEFGNIIYSTLGSADEVALVRHHERVHSALSPKFKLFRNFRAKVGIEAYNRSSFIKYMEEALAESYAQFRVYGIKGIPTGIAFPIKNGYVTLHATVTEAAIGTVVIGGITYGIYQTTY